jgi:putative phage tail component, N-terminal domain protein|uniref:Receptor binding protein n=1 Tax=Siphoviridae sp. ctyQ43 TaxID=2823612 RepID=A0A8S5L9H6_9CAUD|nr:MAG TPA: Receptor binding protein [Siphoviridae sp. ctyQ43]
MYDFIKPGEVGIVPTSLKTIFNGVVLDDTIPGFKTINVEGRTLIGRKNEKRKVPGADGEFLTSSTLDSRPIVVKYLLENTNSNYRDNFNKLNMLLHSDESKILKFTDEPDYYFNAILESVDDIEETSNSVVSTFTFLCLDPYKYKVVDKDTGVNNVTITKLPNNRNEFTPELIKVIVNSVSDKIIIKNQTTTKKIIINHNSFAVGDVLEIDLNKDYPLKLNAMVRSELIDFVESDFDFTVKQGDVITCSNSRVLEIYTKERMY